ncbi:MAG: hypothetical protein J7484_06035 [Microbacterium sp.]|nr:hypothetical protein [Microbacterium sp.]
MTPRGKAALWTVVGALALGFLLFAPLFSAGICVDAQDTSKSYCRDWQTSIVGIETTLWMWLGASGVLVAIGLLVVGLVHRRRDDAGASA